MSGKRHVGTARVPRPARRAGAKRAVGTASVRRTDDTSVLHLGTEPAPPVFVDASGRRRRRLAWLAYAAGLAGLLFVAVLWLSQTGEPVSPRPVLPCATPSHTPAGPTRPTTQPRSAADGGCRALPAGGFGAPPTARQVR